MTVDATEHKASQSSGCHRGAWQQLQEREARLCFRFLRHCLGLVFATAILLRSQSQIVLAGRNSASNDFRQIGVDVLRSFQLQRVHPLHYFAKTYLPLIRTPFHTVLLCCSLADISEEAPYNFLSMLTTVRQNRQGTTSVTFGLPQFFPVYMNMYKLDRPSAPQVGAYSVASHVHEIVYCIIPHTLDHRQIFPSGCDVSVQSGTVQRR